MISSFQSWIHARVGENSRLAEERRDRERERLARENHFIPFGKCVDSTKYDSYY